MANEWIRKEYSGSAVGTTLNGAIGGAAMNIAVTSGSSLPDGSAGPFVMSINRLGTEEKILCSSRSGNTLVVLQRGYDDTAAIPHADLATIEHVYDANSADQSNALASAYTTSGSMAYRGSGLSFIELLAGSNDSVCVVAGGVPTWMTKTNFTTMLFTGTLAGAALTYGTGVLDVAVDNSTIEVSSDALRVKALGISNAQLGTDSVITAKILDGAVTAPKLRQTAGSEAVVTATIRDLNVTVGKLADAAVETVKIKDAAVTNAKLSTLTGEPGGVWNTWNSTTFTNVTGGTIDGRWIKIGKTLFFNARITAGTATAAGTISVRLPGSSTNANQQQLCQAVDGTTIKSADIPGVDTTIIISNSATDTRTSFALGANLSNIRFSGWCNVS